MNTRDDTGQTMVRAARRDATSARRRRQDDTLGLLLETAAALHEAADEQQLAERVMDAACRGTGLCNAALLRPVDTAGRVEVIASNFAAKAETTRGGDGAPSGFSRSLIAAAAQRQRRRALRRRRGGQLRRRHEHRADEHQRRAVRPAHARRHAGRVPLPRLARLAAAPVAPGATRLLRRRWAGWRASRWPTSSASTSSAARPPIESELMAAATAQKWVLPRRETRVGVVHLPRREPARPLRRRRLLRRDRARRRPARRSRSATSPAKAWRRRC